MLKTLRLENFTVFPKAELHFSPGLNVITGENGTGKSHLLKLGYTVLKTLELFGNKTPDRITAEREFAKNLIDIFRPENLGSLVSRVQENAISSISSAWGKEGFIEFSFPKSKTENIDIRPNLQYECWNSSALFIPPKEILSVFEGLQSALEKRELAFDGTYLALSKALNQVVRKEKLPVKTANLAELLEEVLNASVIKKGNRFYFVFQGTNEQLEASLVAEGHRKLGMLAYLILNGALCNKSSLFWDDPEDGLNPGLLSRLAQIMAELSNVMQITIATHSLFLLRELEILQKQNKLSRIHYFGLHLREEGVEVTCGESSNDIGDIAALDANLEQSDRYMNLAYEEVQVSDRQESPRLRRDGRQNYFLGETYDQSV